VLNGDQTLRSGWIRLKLSGSVHLTATAVFQTYRGSGLVGEASVLEAAVVAGGLIHVRTGDGGSNVGIAFSNPQPESNTITLQLFNDVGFLADSREIVLAPNGHLARFVSELFPQLASASSFAGALSVHGSAGFSALALRLSSDKLATLPVSENGMYRPAISGLRVISAQRAAPVQVNFELNVTDFDMNVATGSSSSVSGLVFVDFGSAGYDYGDITMDGNGIIDKASGTLRGGFQLHINGTVPAGTPAVLYVLLYDVFGGQSNFVSLPFAF
jgi:hypothetical protein